MRPASGIWKLNFGWPAEKPPSVGISFQPSAASGGRDGERRVVALVGGDVGQDGQDRVGDGLLDRARRASGG